MNKFTIKLFATLRERAHAAELTREFPDGATVGDIWRQMVVEFPELSGHHDSVGFAVNQEYVEGDFKPRMGDEIAFIPPVSGGAGGKGELSASGGGDVPIHVRVSERPLSLQALSQAVGDESITFDVSKFNWIGSPDSDNKVVVAWFASGVKTIEYSPTRSSATRCGTCGF